MLTTKYNKNKTYRTKKKLIFHKKMEKFSEQY